ncbi:MAG: YIP1 family protein [Terricaulis sp.]
MTTDALDTGERPSLIARVRDILIRPQNEWRRIAAEDPAPLIGSYVLPLAIAGALAGFGAGVFYAGSFALNAALIDEAVSAALYVLFAIAGVMVAGWLINALAPRFGAEANADHAKRLAAYASTPVLVAAVAAVAPPISGIMMGAGVVYALVLIAIGVPTLMPLADADNGAPRFVISFAGAAAAVAALGAMVLGPLIQSGRDALSGAVEVAAPAPAAPPIVRRSAVETTIARLAQSDAPSLLGDPQRLAEQFPDTLPSGFTRQSVSTAQRGGISRADSVYRQGDATLSVAIIQYSSSVDPAAFAALLDVRASGRHEGGYARSQSIDGRLYAEDVGAQTARYVVIGRGVVMIAEGGVTMDQARAAVETIGLQRLEAMFGR